MRIYVRCRFGFTFIIRIFSWRLHKPAIATQLWGKRMGEHKNKIIEWKKKPGQRTHCVLKWSLRGRWCVVAQLKGIFSYFVHGGCHFLGVFVFHFSQVASQKCVYMSTAFFIWIEMAEGAVLESIKYMDFWVCWRK